MKISVVIPCYKQAEYLQTAIDSVLAQTYKNIEIIVVNDGSPDDTVGVVEKYKDQYGIKLINQSNKGLASARNAGIMNMTGDYFFPLDADDALASDCLENIVDAIKHTDADVVAPSLKCFGISEANIILKPSPIELDDFMAGNVLPYCSAIRKQALLEVGGYSPKMDVLGGWEDLHLWYALLSRGKYIHTIQKPLVFYRTKNTSMWTEAEKNKPKLWRQICKDFPQVKKHAKYAKN